MKVSISTTIMVKLSGTDNNEANELILYWKICANFLHVKSKVREKRWVIMNQSRDNNNNILEISSTGLSLFWPGQKRICNLALSLSHLFNWLSYEVVSKSLSSVTCTIPNAHLWNHNGIQSQSSPLKICQKKGMLASFKKTVQWFCFLLIYCTWAQAAEG